MWGRVVWVKSHEVWLRARFAWWEWAPIRLSRGPLEAGTKDTVMFYSQAPLQGLANSADLPGSVPKLRRKSCNFISSIYIYLHLRIDVIHIAETYGICRRFIEKARESREEGWEVVLHCLKLGPSPGAKARGDHTIDTGHESIHTYIYIYTLVDVHLFYIGLHR